MATYHLRKKEREITNSDEIHNILEKNQIVTIAMCHENHPYLVSFNYLYEKSQNCLYFHCANEGKKIDYLTKNPEVCGEILENHGYATGECSHYYRSVHFEGKVSFIQDTEEKRAMLKSMIEHFEEEPESLITRFIKKGNLASVSIGRITITHTTGKQNLPKESPK